MGAAVIETLLQLTGRTKTWPKFVSRCTSLVHVPSCGYIAGILATAAAAQHGGRREGCWVGLVLPPTDLCWVGGFVKCLVTGARATEEGSRWARGSRAA